MGVLLLINWTEQTSPGSRRKEDGHALLAYDYQVSGGGLVVDVVDPNVPWDPSRPTSDYGELQVHVEPDGSWSYLGSFTGTFANLISPSGSRRSGVLQVVLAPVLPGALKFAPDGGAGGATVLEPSEGSSIEAISYSLKPGDDIPADVTSGGGVFDAASSSLLVPSVHHAMTITLASGSKGAVTTYVDGPGFLDRAQLGPGRRNLTVKSHGASVEVPTGDGKTTLSVTRVSDGVQRTVTAHLVGALQRPTLSVSATGEATLVTAGGRGDASLSLATYGPAGERTVTQPVRVRLHGRSRVHSHTPKIKRHKRCKRRRRCKRFR